MAGSLTSLCCLPRVPHACTDSAHELQYDCEHQYTSASDCFSYGLIAFQTLAMQPDYP